MKKNRKKAVIILLFIAGFFSLSLLGITRSDSLEKPADQNVEVAVDQVVQQADEKAIIDQQAIDANKSNILDMNRKSGFSPMNLFRGLMGMLVLVLIAFMFSSNRRAINWGVVGKGLIFQVLLAVGVLYVPFIAAIFDFVGKLFVLILDFTNAGTLFLFKSFATGSIELALQNFAVQILPTIIFFSALTSLLFYLNIIQYIVYGFAWVMTKFMKLSGAESLSVAGNIFLGQTESPLMIKAYLSKMNNSEILLVMLGGMATLGGRSACRVYQFSGRR